MKTAGRIFLLAGFVALAVAGRAADAPLRSPWDGHAVALTGTAYQCPAVPQLPHDFATNSYYVDAHHSIPDPELKRKYEASVEPVEDFTRAIVKAADAYRTTGSRAAAQCAAALLEAAAKQKVLAGKMDGHQAVYVQGWNLGAWAVAFLKIRGSTLVADEQAKEIAKWLKKLAEENRGYYDDRRHNSRAGDARNNHLYWAGFAVAAAGISADDRKLFEWGMSAYKEGIGDIRQDGTLPLELDRGQMALHYHLYALAPLMMLAEFGETNGIDLYAERDFAIKRLVARCVEGIDDPQYFQRRTGVPQVTSKEVEPWQIMWGVAYNRRFHDPAVFAILQRADHMSYTMLGGLPPE